MKALQLIKNGDKLDIQVDNIDHNLLPDAEVLVDIDYSSLNYKDSLAINGLLPSIREYPMVPGIDFAGTVVQSASSDYKAGDKVILNGWGVGENHWGGYAQKARVNAAQLVSLPDKFSTRQAMAIGTAGYTAMLCVMALEKNGLKPDMGEVLVTGASGGVGSVAISLLSSLGYTVVAATGRATEHDYLKSLGAQSIIDRAELSEPGRPLNKERWAGAIDAVGSHTLANICASLKYDGVVAATGLAQGSDLPATVMPFILRGVTLAGVDSVMAPKARREEAWRRLSEDLDLNKLDTMTEEIGLAELEEATAKQLKGEKNHGRTVVNVNL